MVRFCTYNARGLRDNDKRKQLFMLLKYKALDIVFIQESHAIDADSKFWRFQWGGEVIFANATSSSKGVMILLRKGLSYKYGDSTIDPEGRYIITEMAFDSDSVVLCTIYGPNRDTPEFFTQVASEIEKFENRNIILGGDFNFVINNILD